MLSKALPLACMFGWVAVLALATPVFAADEVNVTAATPVTAGPSETVDKTLNIGATSVRVKLVGATAYVAVAKGELQVTYADGTALTTVPAGTALQVNGFLLPGSAVVANLVGGKATLSLGAAATVTLKSNSKGAQLRVAQGGSAAPVALEPGQSVTASAPVTTFGAGQSMELKLNQVGKASAGANEIIAVGTADGLLVTTQKATAAINGSGSDQLILAKDAVLTINRGNLTVTATAIALSGAQLQLVSTAGDIQVVHNGKSMVFATGKTIGAPPPAATATPTTDSAPVVATHNGDEAPDEVETENNAMTTEPDGTEIEDVEVTEAEGEVLAELDAWNAGE